MNMAALRYLKSEIERISFFSRHAAPNQLRTVGSHLTNIKKQQSVALAALWSYLNVLFCFSLILQHRMLQTDMWQDGMYCGPLPAPETHGKTESGGVLVSC